MHLYTLAVAAAADDDDDHGPAMIRLTMITIDGDRDDNHEYSDMWTMPLRKVRHKGHTGKQKRRKKILQQPLPLSTMHQMRSKQAIRQ